MTNQLLLNNNKQDKIWNNWNRNGNFIDRCMKQLQGLLFGSEINVYSDHKNMVYADTLS